MTAIIQKLRRKRKLSSELHSRWGDVAITYPNAGSWSQYEQLSEGTLPSSMPAKTLDQCRRHGSLDSLDRYGHAPTLPSGNFKERTSSTDSAMTMPTGHYDAKLRGRSKKKAPPRSPIVGHEANPTARNGFYESSDDEEEDSVSGLNSPKGRYPRDRSRTNSREEGDAYSRASKSPPLSVTSRMRHCSLQSATTEPTASLPATSSSRHTSYTSSIPSLPPEDPRLGHRPSPRDTKLMNRPKPAPVAEQELVPSYDDLYG
ncbi:hypothetical protein BDV26DRAFT_287984 [Aspergillus bertholletiae]|uniref:Uncharacterized protein n=1 Tax=Aspergillus bertholletiae TaxID=1226010 RepID=A0A5N7BMB0_9EURO|nr:hypothetical protein BDV26DRAFT_287984 [Aspergillus bertholletiae]